MKIYQQIKAQYLRAFKYNQLFLELYSQWTRIATYESAAAEFYRNYLEPTVKIELNSQEQEIANLLLDTAKDLGVSIRLVGGWVRDKLLDSSTNDIDVAIDTGSGLDFANHFANKNSAKVHIVLANPEKSKHLESAIVNFNGYELQFTGFRKETYSNTRIPNVELGTITDDANRRDLTINSLYYNLETKHVEDHTQLGFSDLRAGIIRTPLNPLTTFQDDPLRILRCIRFATRFNFQLASEILEAAKNPEIQNAFRTKVSCERIEIETRKMLVGADPVRAIRLLSDFGLLHDVFQFPPKLVDWEMDQGTPHHQLNVYEHTLEALGNLQTLITKYLPNLPDDDKLVMNYAILFHDLGKLNPVCHGTKVKDGITKRTYYNHERYSLEATDYVLSRLSGTPRKTIERVKNLIVGSSMTNPNYQNGTCNLSRKALCKFIRFCGNDWRLAITVNMADATAKKKNNLDGFDFAYHISMIEKILDLNPAAIMSLKPLMNGDEVFAVIGGKKDKRISEILERLLEYQFVHPKATRKEAEKYVGQFKNK